MAGVPAHNHHQTFEGIKLLDDDGSEFWFARELAPLLDYPHWHNFARLIEKAKLACQRSGQKVADHFYETVKLVELGSGAERRMMEDVFQKRDIGLDAANAELAQGAGQLVAGVLEAECRDLIQQFFREKRRIG